MGLFDFIKKKIEVVQFDTADELFSKIFTTSAPEDAYVHTKRSRSEFEYGCTRRFTYKIRKYCGDCEGSGESVKGSSRQCQKCKENSTIMTPLGPMAFICEWCNGKGYIITNRCNRCGGNGWTEIQESHEVDIPPNFNEQSITIQGKGHYVDSHTRGALVIVFKDARKQNDTEWIDYSKHRK